MTTTPAKIQDRSPIEIRLEWLNNYLTIQKMAEDYNVSEEWLNKTIDEGRRMHQEQLEINTRIATAAPQMHELLKQVRQHSDKLPEHLTEQIANVLYNIDKTVK